MSCKDMSILVACSDSVTMDGTYLSPPMCSLFIIFPALKIYNSFTLSVSIFFLVHSKRGYMETKAFYKQITSAGYDLVSNF